MNDKHEGVVLEEAGGGFYNVELDTGKILRCYLSGKMKRHHIKVLISDRVELIWTRPGDIGRIIKRL